MTTETQTTPVAADTAPKRKRRDEGWSSLLWLLNRRLGIGLVILLIFVAGSLVLPFFSPSDPSQQATYMKNLHMTTKHWLGTTALGQDTFWYLIFAVRNSLLLGIAVGIGITIISTAVGLSAGYIGGAFERIVMLFVDTFITIPLLPILIILGTLIRANYAYLVSIIIIFGWAWNARPYVSAYMLVGFINTVLFAINTEATLAVIGLSKVEIPTLGSIIFWALNYNALFTGNVVWLVAPIVATVLLFLGLFLTSTGFNEAFASRRGVA